MRKFLAILGAAALATGCTPPSNAPAQRDDTVAAVAGLPPASGRTPQERAERQSYYAGPRGEEF